MRKHKEDSVPLLTESSVNLRKVHNVRWARSDSNTLTPKGTDLQSVVTLLRYRSPYHKPVVPLNRKIELRLDHNVLTGRYSPLLFNWRRTHLSTSYHRLTSLICGCCWESALTICHLSVEGVSPSVLLPAENETVRYGY